MRYEALANFKPYMVNVSFIVVLHLPPCIIPMHKHHAVHALVLLFSLFSSPYRPCPKQPPTLPKPQFFTGMKKPCSWDRSLWDLWFNPFCTMKLCWSSWAGSWRLDPSVLRLPPFPGAMSQHSGTRCTLFMLIRSVFISTLFYFIFL